MPGIPTVDLSGAIRHRFSDATSIDFVGEGTFGITYRIGRPGSDFVAKIFKPQFVSGRTDREIEYLSLVHSPYVVSFIEEGKIVHDGQSLRFLATEYVPGHSLRQHLHANGPLTSSKLKRLAQHVGRGLKVLHEEHLTHRDIKPDNIMLSDDNRFVLIDLGCAKREGAASLTLPAEFVGTLIYASLEQLIDSRRVDIRADLFALGCVLFEACVGNNQRPYYTGNEQSRRDLVASLRTGVLRDFDAGPLTPIIKSLLEPIAYRRINSPDALLERLGAL